MTSNDRPGPGRSFDTRALYYSGGSTGWGGNWADGSALHGTRRIQTDEKPHLAKVRVAGSNPVFRSNVMSQGESQGERGTRSGTAPNRRAVPGRPGTTDRRRATGPDRSHAGRGGHAAAHPRTGARDGGEGGFGGGEMKRGAAPKQARCKLRHIPWLCRAKRNCTAPWRGRRGIEGSDTKSIAGSGSEPSDTT